MRRIPLPRCSQSLALMPAPINTRALGYRRSRVAASWRALQCVVLPLLAESERSICLITSICAEDGSTRTDYSCMMASTRSVTVDTEAIMRNIFVIRGRRVLLDSDLAALYQVATKALTRAVRRNPGRFPADFMFQLAVEESASLRSQSGALKTGRGKHRKYAPYVFTEQGIAMLSSVLTSERAVQVNIEIMRAFIRLRQAVSTHEELRTSSWRWRTSTIGSSKWCLTRSVA